MAIERIFQLFSGLLWFISNCIITGTWSVKDANAVEKWYAVGVPNMHSGLYNILSTRRLPPNSGSATTSPFSFGFGRMNGVAGVMSWKLQSNLD